MQRIEFGVTVRDVVTGFEGVVTGYSSYITGCDHYCVQPRCKDKHTRPDAKWIDDHRLEVRDKKKKVTVFPSAKLGADIPAPIR